MLILAHPVQILVSFVLLIIFNTLEELRFRLGIYFSKLSILGEKI